MKLDYDYVVRGQPTLPKPADIHDRDREWATLSRFATDPEPGIKLAIVYGRRRQGKTLLLERLCAATDGFMFVGVEESGRQNLDRFSEEYARYSDGPMQYFNTWWDAIDAVVRLGEREGGKPVTIVLDEFQYLIDGEPLLPSIVKLAMEPTARAYRHGRARLILCGSALHVMSGLLAGPAPLRGRAVNEVVIRPFWYRDAAAFWYIDNDPDLAFRVNALMGGTPAYRSMSGGPPASAEDFDDWVVQGPLSGDTPAFREGALLLHEHTELSDLSLYYSVLSAISKGACRPSEIGAILGRPDNTLAHPLAVLEATQLIEKEDDAFRERRPVYRIAEPLIRFHRLLIAPNEGDLIRRGAVRVWADSADTVTSKIYGPHLEHLAREWCLSYARRALGDSVSVVRSSVLACRQHRERHELDVVAIKKSPFDKDVVLAIGEAKSTARPVGDGDLARLEHLRDLVPKDRYEEVPKVLLFSRFGFTDELRATARRRDDVELIDLERLYYGE